MSPYTIRDISCYVVCKMTDQLILLCNMLRCTVLHALPVPTRKKVWQRKSIYPASQIQILKRGRNTIYFQRFHKSEFSFNKSGWGRGASRLLVRRRRLLYLSTILRNKSVSTKNSVLLNSSHLSLQKLESLNRHIIKGSLVFVLPSERKQIFISNFWLNDCQLV